jgi:hypothetical protein
VCQICRRPLPYSPPGRRSLTLPATCEAFALVFARCRQSQARPPSHGPAPRWHHVQASDAHICAGSSVQLNAASAKDGITELQQQLHRSMRPYKEADEKEAAANQSKSIALPTEPSDDKGGPLDGAPSGEASTEDSSSDSVVEQGQPPKKKSRRLKARELLLGPIAPSPVPSPTPCITQVALCCACGRRRK